jgi:hypothetical protein
MPRIGGITGRNGYSLAVVAGPLIVCKRMLGPATRLVRLAAYRLVHVSSSSAPPGRVARTDLQQAELG